RWPSTRPLALTCGGGGRTITEPQRRGPGVASWPIRAHSEPPFPTDTSYETTGRNEHHGPGPRGGAGRGPRPTFPDAGYGRACGRFGLRTSSRLLVSFRHDRHLVRPDRNRAVRPDVVGLALSHQLR